jgi:hypothetical protein
VLKSAEHMNIAGEFTRNGPIYDPLGFAPLGD